VERWGNAPGHDSARLEFALFLTVGVQSVKVIRGGDNVDGVADKVMLGIADHTLVGRDPVVVGILGDVHQIQRKAQLVGLGHGKMETVRRE